MIEMVSVSITLPDQTFASKYFDSSSIFFCSDLPGTPNFNLLPTIFHKDFGESKLRDASKSFYDHKEDELMN